MSSSQTDRSQSAQLAVGILAICITAGLPFGAHPAHASVQTGSEQTAVRYTVSAGENLFRIALNHGFTTEQLAEANGISAPYTIHPGQELIIPGQAAETTSAPVGGDELPAVEIRYAQPERDTIEPIQRPQQSDATAEPRFILPAEGRIIERERRARDGDAVPGWTIEMSAGASLHAAADGQVMYAGNGVPGFTNLILIRHDAEWVTAYGNPDDILVQQGATVRAGEPIASTRRSLFNRRSEVYFEVRNGVIPVDPTPFLVTELGTRSTARYRSE